MSIVKENLDAVNAVLKINITPEDYKDNLTAELKNAQKHASLKGFRQGKVPMGLIKKMYENSLKAQELDKLIQKELTDYLSKNEIALIGQPLPSKTAQKEQNIETDEELEFAFDIGLMQELDMKLDEIVAPKYKVTITDETLDFHIEQILKKNGENKEVDVIEDDKASVIASFSEIDENGVEIDGGIKSEDVRFLVTSIKDEEIKNSFIGKNKSEIVEVDIKKTFPNDTEIAALLKIEKEQVEAITNRFNLTINKIEAFADAELNEDVFSKIYGETVNSVDEFRKKVREDLGVEYNRASDFKVFGDVKEVLDEKYNPEIPEAFFCRWLAETQKMEQAAIDKYLASYLKELKWETFKFNLSKKYDIKVDKQEVEELAGKLVRQQFASFGMMDIADADLKGYIGTLLKDDEQAKRMYDTVFNEKLTTAFLNNCKFEEKEIGSKDFDELMKKDQEKANENAETAEVVEEEK